MKRLLKWAGITISLILLFLFLGVNNDDMAEEGKSPIITIRKYSYNEETKVLNIIVTLNPGFKIKGYSMDLKYDKNKVESLTKDDIKISDGPKIPVNKDDEDSYSVEGGTIKLKSVQREDEIEIVNEDIICTIRLKLKDINYEEDIPNNILTVNGATIDYNDGLYDNYKEKEYVKVAPMSIPVTSITLTNSVFDYTTDTNGDGENDSYKYGENINLIGGTATVTYSNGKTRTATLNRNEENGTYKWVEIKDGIVTNNVLDITTIPAKANTLETQYVHIEYKEMQSNEVGVKVIDYITGITLTPKTTYYYGEKFGSDINIKWASKENAEIKTVQELIDNEQIEINGFNSTLDEIKKSSIEQDVTVTFNYEGYTGTQNFTVTIKDIIDEITLGLPSKLKYKYGEERLNLDNGTINIKWRSGEESRDLNTITRLEGSDPVEESILSQGLKAAIDLDDTIKITGFNSSVCGTDTINLEYHYTDQDGNTQIKTGLTYDIEIVDYIEDITLEPITEYHYGDDFDTERSMVNIKWASKEVAEEKTLKELIENGQAEISGFNSTSSEIKKSLVGVKQNVTVTFTYEESAEVYEDYTKTTEPFEVTIKDQIEEVTFEEGTIKKDYEYQEPSLDLTGGKINIKWLSEATDERPLNNIEIKTGSSSITNNNEVVSHLEDSILVTGFDSEQFGEETITIKYYYAGETNPKEFSYNIKINAGIQSIDLNKNEITIPYDQDITDEYLKENNINVIITNTDGTTRNPIPVKAEWIGEYNKTKEKIGKRQETYVEYNGTQLPFYITIENCLEHIELTKNIITVQWGETLNFTDEYKVIPVMADETREEEILFTNNKVQIEGNYNLKDEGTYKVKVAYEGKKADFTIIVVDSIIEVRLDEDEEEKIQKEYKYNEELNLNEAKLTIIKESSKEVGPYKETISRNWTDYDKEEIGKQKITINYKDDETQEIFTLEECFEVEVKDYITDIILVKPNKSVYLPDEKLDLTGAKVRTISASGKLGNEVAVTEDMISGYTEGILGVQRITVKFEGFEKDFDVIFTAQTGVASYNTYKILATIIATASLTIIAMLTIIQKEEERNKKM